MEREIKKPKITREDKKDARDLLRWAEGPEGVAEFLGFSETNWSLAGALCLAAGMWEAWVAADDDTWRDVVEQAGAALGVTELLHPPVTVVRFVKPATAAAAAN